MSRAVDGTYETPSNSVAPAVASTTIDPDDFNTLVTDMETAISDSVYTSGMTAVDNRLTRTDGTNGKKLQASVIAVDDSGNMSGMGYMDIAEIAAPASPAANTVRVYAVDNGGISKLAYKDSVGTVTTFGTASQYDVGTSATNVVQLDGSAKLPAVDGSQLTNIPGAIAPNLLTNGGFRINQRVASSGIADDTYCFDRWYALTQTGTITVGAQTNLEDTTPYAIRLTQAQAVAQRMGLAQILPSADCIAFRGQAVTLSARVRMSASTTLRYAILEWTGTADVVTSDWVLSWTSATFTAGNFFTTTSTTVTTTGSTALTANTLTTISLTGTVSSSANNIAVMFWTDSTQAQNGTLDIAKAKLEPGSTATTFRYEPLTLELTRCYEFYQKSYAIETAPGTATAVGQISTNAGSTSASVIWGYSFMVAMRALPTFAIYNPNTGTSGQYYNASAPANKTFSSTIGLGTKTLSGITGTTGNTTGDVCHFQYTNDAEL